MLFSRIDTNLVPRVLSLRGRKREDPGIEVELIPQVLSLGMKTFQATSTKQVLIPLRDPFQNYRRATCPFYIGVHPGSRSQSLYKRFFLYLGSCHASCPPYPIPFPPYPPPKEKYFENIKAISFFTKSDSLRYLD